MDFGSEKIPENLYQSIPINDLILVGIYQVKEKGEVCTFERLVKECFEMFPKVFGFMRYPEWPDSLKFDRPLRTLRSKGYIVGSVKSEFMLTPFGERHASSILKRILGNSSKKGGYKRPVGRSMNDRLIQSIRESAPFKRYKKDQENFKISETEYRSLLNCTFETPERIIIQNLNYLENLAKSYQDQEILDFLNKCRKIIMKKRKRKQPL